jgi:hypothetical protein
VNDTVAGGHNSKVVEGLFTPLKESKALLVAIKFDLLVLFFCVGFPCHVDLD